MFNLKKKLTIAALVAASTLNVANAGVLDTFDNYSVDLEINSGTVSQTFSAVTDQQPAGDVTYNLAWAGTYGDMAVETESHASVGGGLIDFSQDSNVKGDFDISYTAANGAWDLTDGYTSTAFYFDLLDIDSDFDIEITVDSQSSVLSVLETQAQSRVFLSFTNFSGVDFSSVSSVVFDFDTQLAGDFAIAEIGTVPEPTSLAILGLGLLGFAASRKKSA